MTTGTQAPVRIAQVPVRVRPDTDMGYAMMGWRMGPKTDDGYWLVSNAHRLHQEAVRIIVDHEAPFLSRYGVDQALTDAFYADLIAAQDDYLAALTVAAQIAPDELYQLRDAVLAGRTGGANDGATRRRSRKAVQS